MQKTKNRKKKREPGERCRAAMYLRMSSEHQKYSIENQTAAMHEYAAKNNIDIVKTYTDGAKSGIKIDWRPGLKQLIADVTAGTEEFTDILVLDVTRFGRFLKNDEAAYYEFSCVKAGYRVIYTAENFRDDGTAWAGMEKNMKRGMAGEYSRELSGKVFRGQCTLIRKGFKQGGLAGYGLRRMLIDEASRAHKGVLALGDRKALQTDRVILVPGPKEEVETVRWMYKSFVEDGLAEMAIAHRLNQQGVLTDLGRPWTRSVVHGILTNEKYIGNNVFNRASFRLKEERVVNKPEEWVRADGAFERIVEPHLFYMAREIIRERSLRLSDDDMLSKLKALHERQGWLSGFIIDEAEDMPPSSAYSSRFGSLVRAYKLIGYTPDRDLRFIEINRRLRQIYSELVKSIVEKIVSLGGRVKNEEKTGFLVVNEELKLAVVISRCRQENGRLRWKVCLDTGLEPDLTLIVRMAPDNEQPLDYYLLPALDVEEPRLRLAEENSLALDTFRFDNLDQFFIMAERVPIPEAQ